MVFNRRKLIKNAPAFAIGAVVPATLVLEGCGIDSADDLTLLIAGLEGAVDIVLPLLGPAESALVPLINTVLNDASQAATEWESSDTTEIKLSKILQIMLNIPALPDLPLISGIVAAVNVILKTIQAIQSANNTSIRRLATTAPAPALSPNRRGILELKDAIKKTQDKLNALKL